MTKEKNLLLFTVKRYRIVPLLNLKKQEELNRIKIFEVKENL